MTKVPAIYRKSTAVSRPHTDSAIIAVGAAVPREIEDGILAIPVAFPAHRSQDEGERNLGARLRLEAFEGFEVFIAAFVLKRVRLRNPRHPFPPNGQDLFELAEKTRKVLRRGVSGTCLGGEKWVLCSSDLPSGWFDLTPEPFTAGSLVPDGVARAWLREIIAKTADIDELTKVANWTYRDYRSGYSYLPDYLRRDWSPTAIKRLPDDALPDGFRAAYEAAVARLGKLRQHEAEERDKEAAATQERRRNKHGILTSDAECLGTG